jgi:RNA polymerase sigma factor (sigma-70 family)
VTSHQHEPSDLLRRFRRGESETCQQVERWALEVVRSRRYGVLASDHDDLVQETLRQTWEQVSDPDFELSHSLRALVHRIAMARCVDWLRRRRVQVEVQDDLLREVPDPTARLELEQQVDRLQGALGSLKPLCRDLIRWHFHERRTYGDIARDTGRNESTLRVHMFNCLKALRSLMGAGDATA